MVGCCDRAQQAAKREAAAMIGLEAWPQFLAFIPSQHLYRTDEVSNLVRVRGSTRAIVSI
ncbi:MAG: hypothetical protein EAZ61_07740 [Oscillatoriales cyanobacterium]|nr:MAG: hypothetical protein EAZ61_07740 [Oscillatoriales cyanobacterium]